MGGEAAAISEGQSRQSWGALTRASRLCRGNRADKGFQAGLAFDKLPLVVMGRVGGKSRWGLVGWGQ